MNFKALSTSTKKYIILLIVSVGVLLIAEGLTFKQLALLTESADRVAQTLEVEKGINNLFSHYSRMQAEELTNLLISEEVQDTSWEDHKQHAYTTFKTLEILLKDSPKQRQRLREIGQLQDVYYTGLSTLRKSGADTLLVNANNQPTLIKVTQTLEAIRKVKNQMLLEEHRMATLRKEEFDKQADTTPLFTLLLALFALAVILLAFARIYRNKERIRASQEFLKSILRNTTNIVNYYEPVYDNSGNVKDFRVVFANECNRLYLGLNPEKMEGKLVSSVFPFLDLNVELNELIRSFTEQKRVHLDRQISVKGKRMWFRSTIVPHANGILLTESNTTREKEDEEKLRDLNEQLRNQNEELLRTEAFLEGVLRSTKNVIMSFEPVWEEMGTIADFKLLYINIATEGIVDTRSPDPVGRKISEISPMIFNSQVFGHMVECYKNDKLIDFETSYTNLGIEYWLQGTAIKWHQVVTLNLVDITNQIHAEQNLRKRNLQLKRSNDELESFNRVASHDLQEPLRKIQMFLSRFFDTEKAKLSSKGQEYLGKVNKAAERMQSLIVNLLAYSRIDNTNDDFEEVDLNLILKKVQEDLALPIKETGAKIKQDVLPTIKGVPFQMEQLFLNLLSNALKYRKEDTQLKIVIKVEEVHRRQINENFIRSSRNYYKITVRDNGIGFDPANASKIFEVFQRLHQKNEYSGTGIGLAICKKIVENHLGHIHATGEPGEGSTFIMYFPH
jgi:signal transduction histidine kinase/PAS domain-containing protein